MDSELTDITLVVDRSGSMQQIRGDAEGGVNAFIEEQAKEPGKALLTLVQFDTEYEFVRKGMPLLDVPKYDLVPRGATALLDAVGRAINETGERLAGMDEADRPGLVIFVVMTDGHENSSVEFTRTQIKKMIEHQQDEYSWHFTFLAANQDAFDEGGEIGLHAAGIANVNINKMYQAYDSSSKKLSRMRKQRRTGQPVSNAFTDEERADMA
jgi:hypothetical protein